MNRRGFLFGGAVVCGTVPLAAPTAAYAVRLPTSRVTVNVLTVTRESFERHATSRRDVTLETSTFLAKARVVAVLNNEHGLSPGTIIDIRYKTTVRQPPTPTFPRSGSLTEGQTVTLTVFGSGTSFTWRT